MKLTALLLLSLGIASARRKFHNEKGHHHIHEEEDFDDDATELDEVLPSAAEAKTLLHNFAAIFSKHGRDASRLFVAYNSKVDATDNGMQHLNKQELRVLMRDIGVVGTRLLRAELVEAAIALLDSSGDRKVSEAELAAAVDLLGCWLGDGGRTNDAQSAAGPGDVGGTLTRAQQLGSKLSALGEQRSLIAFFALQEEVHATCTSSLDAWWQSGWSQRLSHLFHSSDAAKHELSGRKDVYHCAARLPDRLLTHAFYTKPLRAGVTAFRTMLKLGGVSSLLLRHVVATRLVHLLDRDSDGKVCELTPCEQRNGGGGTVEVTLAA